MSGPMHWCRCYQAGSFKPSPRSASQDFDAKHQRALNYEDFDTAAEIRKHRQRVRLPIRKSQN